MMTTDYELSTDALQAEGAYYDQLAQEQSAQTTPPPPEPAETKHLQMAREWMDVYDYRTNEQKYAPWDAQRDYEDRAYKQAMLHATYANAEAATRQAEVAESMLEFVADLIGRTDLVDALLQWSYRQRAG